MQTRQDGKQDKPAIRERPESINLEDFPEQTLLGKKEMCRLLGCSERTLARMVERSQIPPPTTLGNRSVWLAEKVRNWLYEAAAKKEAEAVKEARRLKVFRS